MATIHEMLRQIMQIKHKIGTKLIMVMYRQFYSKALEIQWKYQENFEFMAFIAKIFYSAVLRDVPRESGVIAVESVGRVLDGNAYKRAIRFYKLMYGTCLCSVYTKRVF